MSALGVSPSKPHKPWLPQWEWGWARGLTVNDSLPSNLVLTPSPALPEPPS